MNIISERLTTALEQQHMTQAELCEKTGISRSTMSQYCSGSFRPKADKLQRIAKALHVNEAWLLGYETKRKRLFLWKIIRTCVQSD